MASEKIYSDFTLLTTMYWQIRNYLPIDDPFGLQRFFVYNSHKEVGRVSIKAIKEYECGACSEKAGLAHNMFKIFGLNSSLVAGRRDTENHAYNLIYPTGYESGKAILYDPSFNISFLKSNGKKYDFPYFGKLTREEYDSLQKGEGIKLDISPSNEVIKQLYNGNGILDDTIILQDSPVYYKGMGRTRLEIRNNELTDLENEAQKIAEGEKKIIPPGRSK